MPQRIASGPVMLDVTGTELTREDRDRLLHPSVGGVILFARNFESPQQLACLTAAIHELRDPALLIAVDHEGGRVQRFRDGFTAIAPMRALGKLWDAGRARSIALAQSIGFVIATELRAGGVDLSFTPVLDVDHGASSVIGDRAFHCDPRAIAELAGSMVKGLARGGMGAVGKHFPGHGYIAADSHHEVPVDNRAFSEIERCDLLPFAALIGQGLGAIMPAHVIYPQVDAKPAGFSRVWLRDILRSKLRFDGVIFSDDLSMEGAATAGGIVERARAATQAGCDMVLVCNNPAAADALLAGFDTGTDPAPAARIARLRHADRRLTREELRSAPDYIDALAAIDRMEA